MANENQTQIPTEEQAAANPPVAPQPKVSPDKTSELLNGLRWAAVAPTAAEAAVAGAVAKLPQVQQFSKEVKENITNPQKRAELMMSIPQTAMEFAEFEEGVPAPIFSHIMHEKGGEIHYENEKGIQGTLKYNHEGDTSRVTAVNVEPDFRGKGIATRMYEMAARDAKAAGKNSITSDVKGTTSYDASQVWEKLMKKYPNQITRTEGKAGSPAYKWTLKQTPKEVTEAKAFALKTEPKSEVKAKQTPKEIIEGQGLKYKGELIKGSDVHMFEHPDHPGKTASLNERDITPEGVKNKMKSKLEEFEVAEKRLSKK